MKKSLSGWGEEPLHGCKLNDRRTTKQINFWGKKVLIFYLILHILVKHNVVGVLWKDSKLALVTDLNKSNACFI